MQIVYLVCILISCMSLVSMKERTTAMILSLKQYVSGNTSREEYILDEFLETTINLAELVMYMATFDYALGKISGGSGSGEGVGGAGVVDSKADLGDKLDYLFGKASF